MHLLAPSAPAALGPDDREFIATHQSFDFVPMPSRLEGQRLIWTKVVRVDGAPDDVPTELRDVGVHIVESFYRARFGDARFTPEEIQSASATSRPLIRLFVGINAAVLCFFVLVLAVRVGLDYLS